MKSATALLSLAALASAIVLPDEQVFAQIPFEATSDPESFWDKAPSFNDFTDRIKKPFRHVPETLDHPLDLELAKLKHHECGHKEGAFETPAFDFQAWIEHGLQQHAEHQEHPRPPPPPPPSPPPYEDGPPPPPFKDGPPPPDAPPHHGPPAPPHGPPHDGPPHHGPPPHHKPPGKGPHKKPGKGHKKHGKHGKHGKHPHKKPGFKFPHHHHHKVNLTIYELISKSNYTKILAKYIDEDKDLVKLLNGTKANYTLYAPTDWAFKKLPKGFKPPKELVKKVLQYHVSPGLYPSFRLLFAHTVPTLYEPETLGGNPQRILARWFGPFKGLKLNYYSKVLVANIVRIPSSS
jgi:Fasciclin domain